MLKTISKLKAWGNSIGVILPKDKLQREHLGVEDEVEVIVRKKTNPLEEAFGILKGLKARSNKSTDEILREIDKELDSRLE